MSGLEILIVGAPGGGSRVAVEFPSSEKTPPMNARVANAHRWVKALLVDMNDEERHVLLLNLCSDQEARERMRPR